MFSTMPRTGTRTCRNISSPLRASMRATSCGVVTITAPESGAVGVHKADAVAFRLEGQGEVGGHGRFAHAALAAGDGEEVLDARKGDLLRGSRWRVHEGVLRSILAGVATRLTLTQGAQVFEGED